MAHRIAGMLNRFSTKELAERSGIAKQTLSRWKNSRTIPAVEFLEALAQATGITIDELAQAVADDKAARTAEKQLAKQNGRARLHQSPTPGHTDPVKGSHAE